MSQPVRITLLSKNLCPNSSQVFWSPVGLYAKVNLTHLWKTCTTFEFGGERQESIVGAWVRSLCLLQDRDTHSSSSRVLTGRSEFYPFRKAYGCPELQCPRLGPSYSGDTHVPSDRSMETDLVPALMWASLQGPPAPELAMRLAENLVAMAWRGVLISLNPSLLSNSPLQGASF